MLERTFKQGYSVNGKYAVYWAEPEHSHDIWDVNFQVEGAEADLADTRAFYLDQLKRKKSAPVLRKDLLHGVFMILGKTVSADVVVLSLQKLLDHIVANGMFIGERNGKRVFEQVRQDHISTGIVKFEKECFEFRGTYVAYAISPDEIQCGLGNVRSLMLTKYCEEDIFKSEAVLKPDTIYSDVIVLVGPTLSAGDVNDALIWFLNKILKKGMFVGYDGASNHIRSYVYYKTFEDRVSTGSPSVNLRKGKTWVSR